MLMSYSIWNGCIKVMTLFLSFLNNCKLAWNCVFPSLVSARVILTRCKKTSSDSSDHDLSHIIVSHPSSGSCINIGTLLTSSVIFMISEIYEFQSYTRMLFQIHPKISQCYLSWSLPREIVICPFNANHMLSCLDDWGWYNQKQVDGYIPSVLHSSHWYPRYDPQWNGMVIAKYSTSQMRQNIVSLT